MKKFKFAAAIILIITYTIFTQLTYAYASAAPIPLAGVTAMVIGGSTYLANNYLFDSNNNTSEGKTLKKEVDFSNEEFIKKLQEKLENHRKEKGVQAISMTIGYKGKFKDFYSGKINNQTNADSIDSNSVFEIAGVSKLYISVLALKLEVEGKLNIEDKIGDYFKDKYPAWKNITIKQLLNMTSGIPNYYYFDNKSYSGIRKNPWSLDELVKLVDQKLDFTPGKKRQSSDTGYVIAEMIIKEVTSNTTIHKNMEKEIFRPLGLKHTLYNYDTNLEYTEYFNNKAINIKILESKEDQDSYNNMVRGYYYKDKANQDVTNCEMVSYNAARGMVSTTNDTAVFIRSIFNGFLPQKQFEEITSLDSDSSWGEGVWADISENNGYNHAYAYIQSKDIVISIATNTVYTICEKSKKDIENLLKEIITLINGD